MRALVLEKTNEIALRDAAAFGPVVPVNVSRIDVKPLTTDGFSFREGVRAFDFARRMPPTSVKAQTKLEA